MPLSPPATRHLRHRRAIRVEAFERDDGLWDIEACLTDHKPRDVALASGVRTNGQPIHELWLRITIDRELTVVDAEASSDWVPYPGSCQASNPAYRALIGLNLRRHFRREAGRLLGGTAGCTHLTELCAVMPTAAIQAFAGDVWDTEKSSASDSDTGAGNEQEQPPFQYGRCHALRFDGEVVREFYPRWFGHTPRGMTTAKPDHGHTEDGQGNEVHSNSQTEGNHA